MLKTQEAISSLGTDQKKTLQENLSLFRTKVSLADVNNLEGLFQRTLQLETNPLREKSITIHKLSELDQKTRTVALQTIAAINQVTSTTEGTTWEPYTSSILERLQTSPSSADTLFVAKARLDDQEQFVGYSVFYVLKDKIPYPSHFLSNDGEAYCSWIAVDKEFKGQKIAEKLQLKIFENSPFTAFIAHIKKTNTASLRAFEKLSSHQDLLVKKQNAGHQVVYTVRKVT
jgi:ribosomal protein S18 acetylase RimI-like enzyme